MKGSDIFLIKDASAASRCLTSRVRNTIHHKDTLKYKLMQVWLDTIWFTKVKTFHRLVNSSSLEDEYFYLNIKGFICLKGLETDQAQFKRIREHADTP